jgi:hypothetical protein
MLGRMIVRRLKSIEEIVSMLQPYKGVAIIGCAGCYGEGGKEGVARVAEKLKEKGVEVVATGVTGRQCGWAERAAREGLKGEEAVTKLLRGVKGEVGRAEALLSLACGVGAQTLAGFAGNKALLPGFNTFFMGRREAARFMEQCVGCGNCILHLTAGICPVAKCPKSDLNGPCGGVNEGRCEVYPSRECVWIRIYERLKSVGRLEDMRRIKEAKDFSIRVHPRRLEIG